MAELLPSNCPDCQDPVDRRDFLRVVSGSAAALAVGTVLPTVPAVAAAPQAATTPAQPAAPRPAEALIRELWGTLSNEQRTQVVKPWDHRSAMMLTRHRMVNAALDRRIGQAYTPAQRDLLTRILRSMCSDDEGYDRICRRENANTAWDNSGSFDNLGADFFGSMAENSPWSFVFSGHHLTVRCDGNSEPDYAFGGPIYYGHTPDGYSRRNVFYHQTQAVLSVFDSLNEQQRRQAVVVGTPGELEPSIRFRANQAFPGIAAADLSRVQKLLVLSVMREVLSPFRREDGDEVMDLVNRNGGLNRIHLAFYRDRNATDNTRWHFWRLEGPGFVWNYRVLPHVHTYVNIAIPPRA